MNRRLGPLLAVLSLGLVVLLVFPAAMLLLLISGSAPQAAGDDCGRPVIGASFVTGGPQRLPVVGGFVVTSEYGMRYHPTLHYTRLHAGIDLAETPGPTTVVAAQAGKVLETAHNAGGAGNYVRIDHGGGFNTRYLHLSQITVSVGQSVTAGEPIGVEGATGGISTGAHLHFETIQDGTAYNPREWFARAGITVPPLGGSGVAPAAGGATSSEPTTAAVQPAVDTGLPAAVGQWKGEQLKIAATIIKVAQSRGLDAHGQALGVMTGMGESSLTNVSHGDAVRADTIGVFQEGPERGTYQQRMDPAQAAGIFYDYLLKAAPDWKSLPPTIAAHKAQANAAPHYYAQFWPEAVRVVAALTKDPSLLDAVQIDGASALGCVSDAVATGADASSPLGSCPPTGMSAEAGLQPPALRVMRCGVEAFPFVKTVYGLGERVGPSDHATGEAVDLMIDNYKTPQGHANGQRVAEWAVGHAKELGISYVIWDMQIWTPSRGWHPYTRYGNTPDDNLAHKNHVHISVTAGTGA